jgi:hypothetical protein
LAKGINAKDIQREMFPVYSGSLSRKAFHNWVEKHGRLFANNKKVETKVKKWLRQQSKDFCSAGFDAMVMQWGKCINVSGGYVEK